ncbi:conserved hypothetical protein [Ricinus communis]|uniref:Uncharacterized protein n=1 Tax=Ricinus communis TaxID=3988 RepID=B9T8X8_RICCO|nr:conserved hypothetical protein [Ricinus communis]
MFQEPMLPIRSAPTIETMPAADMQTIEDGPRGEELEPDNNPQAPVLKKSEYLAIGKSPSVNAASNTGGSSPSRGQQEEELVGRNFFDNQDPLRIMHWIHPARNPMNQWLTLFFSGCRTETSSRFLLRRKVLKASSFQ